MAVFTAAGPMKIPTFDVMETMKMIAEIPPLGAGNTTTTNTNTTTTTANNTTATTAIVDNDPDIARFASRARYEQLVDEFKIYGESVGHHYPDNIRANIARINAKNEEIRANDPTY